MKRSVGIPFAASLLLTLTTACGGKQSLPPDIDTRPLEAGKAAQIIEEVLEQRGYAFEKGINVQTIGTNEFPCDYRIKGEAIAIEFLTEKDRRAIGSIPDPAAGSRLHVLSGTASSPAAGGSARIYIFFIDDRNFIYHANPTSETRADVTFLEVDSRLRRDISDFLSWYEDAEANR